MVYNMVLKSILSMLVNDQWSLKLQTVLNDTFMPNYFHYFNGQTKYDALLVCNPDKYR